MNKKRVKRIARSRAGTKRNVAVKQTLSLATTKVPKKVFTMVSSPTQGNISLPSIVEPEYTPPVNSGYTPPANNTETGALNPSDVSAVQNPSAAVGEEKGTVEKFLTIGSAVLIGVKLFSFFKSKTGVSKTDNSKSDG